MRKAIQEKSCSSSFSQALDEIDESPNQHTLTEAAVNVLHDLEELSTEDELDNLADMDTRSWISDEVHAQEDQEAELIFSRSLDSYLDDDDDAGMSPVELLRGAHAFVPPALPGHS